MACGAVLCCNFMSINLSSPCPPAWVTKVTSVLYCGCTTGTMERDRAHNSGIGRAAQRSTTPGFFSPVVIRAMYVTEHTIAPTSTTTQCTSVVTHPKNSTIGSSTIKWVTRKLFQSGPAHYGFVSPARSGSVVLGAQQRQKHGNNDHCQTCTAQTPEAHTPMVILFPSKNTCFEEPGMLPMCGCGGYGDFSRCEKAQGLLRISMVPQMETRVLLKPLNGGSFCVTGERQILCAASGSMPTHNQPRQRRKCRRTTTRKGASAF